jgi:hypothetical protein
MTTREFVASQLELLEVSQVFKLPYNGRNMLAYVAHPPSDVRDEPSMVWITVGPLSKPRRAVLNNVLYGMDPLMVLKLPRNTLVRISNHHLRQWVLGY